MANEDYMSRKRPRFEKDGVPEYGDKEEKEQSKEEYDAFKFMKNKKQVAAVAGVFFVLGFIVSALVPTPLTGMVVSSDVAANADEIGQAGVDFLNEYFVEGGGVTLKSVDDTGSLIEVTTEYNGNEIPIQMTPDGEYIILGGVGAVNMAEYKEQASQEPDSPEPAPDAGVPKTDKPVVNAFIMSYCPYGLQMQKALIPVMELLGDKADISVNFVNYVMHGEKEMVDNNYEYCIQKEQPEVFTDYLRCFVDKEDRVACMTEASVDTAKVDSCLQYLEDEFDVTNVFTSSTERYPPYPVEDDLATLYGVRGSPTVVINGQTVSVARSAEAVKQAVCDAFTTPPEECSTTLNTNQEQPGAGPVGSGTVAASGADATCG